MPVNISSNNDVPLPRDCSDGYKVLRLRELLLFSFTLAKPPGQN